MGKRFIHQNKKKFVSNFLPGFSFFGQFSLKPTNRDNRMRINIFNSIMNLSYGYLYKINIIIKLNYTFIKINIESFRFDSTTVLQIRDEPTKFLIRWWNRAVWRSLLKISLILTGEMFCCLLKCNRIILSGLTYKLQFNLHTKIMLY